MTDDGMMSLEEHALAFDQPIKPDRDPLKTFLSGLKGGKNGLYDPRNPNGAFAEYVTHPNRAYEEKPLTIEDVRTAVDRLYRDATTSWTPEERLRGMSKPVREALLPLFEGLRASRWTPEAFRQEYLGEFVADE